jgi:excisionase family DNA binding protein
MPSTRTVADVAARYGVSEHTVLTWIRNRELRAVNVGRRPRAGKPRWRITEDALADFERVRTPTPPPPQARRRRRPAEVIEFYR